MNKKVYMNEMEVNYLRLNLFHTGKTKYEDNHLELNLPFTYLSELEFMGLLRENIGHEIKVGIYEYGENYGGMYRMQEVKLIAVSCTDNSIRIRPAGTTNYIALSFRDVFPDKCTIEKKIITPAEAKSIIDLGIVSRITYGQFWKNGDSTKKALAISDKYGFPIPMRKTKVTESMNYGESLLVCDVKGIEKLRGTINPEEYRKMLNEVLKFKFILYTAYES